MNVIAVLLSGGPTPSHPRPSPPPWCGTSRDTTSAGLISYSSLAARLHPGRSNGDHKRRAKKDPRQA